MYKCLFIGINLFQNIKKKKFIIVIIIIILADLFESNEQVVANNKTKQNETKQNKKTKEL